MIEGLEDALSNWYEDEKVIGQIASNYFKSMFQTSNPEGEAMETTLESLSSKISPSQKK